MTQNMWDPLCAGCPDRWDTPLLIYDCHKCHELLGKEKPIVLPFCPALNILDSSLLNNHTSQVSQVSRTKESSAIPYYITAADDE